MSGGQFKPIYTNADNVKVRLANKVQFQSGSTPAQGELSDAFLNQLICDAETMVEQDLRQRYAIPFRSACHGTWAALPDHSRRALRTAVDLRAVVLILKTDFGAGTHISGDAFSKNYQDEYEDYLVTLLGRGPEGKNDKIDRFRHSPPLEDVLLAAGNRKADDGFRGVIINTDASDNDAVSYASKQINNPAASYVNRKTRPF